MAWKARFVLLCATADHIFPLISTLITRLPPTDRYEREVVEFNNAKYVLIVNAVKKE